LFFSIDYPQIELKCLYLQISNQNNDNENCLFSGKKYRLFSFINDDDEIENKIRGSNVLG
ncbi:hypothetical protein DERP_013564, partial [Dermatophagoides pteronyssinus]